MNLLDTLQISASGLSAQRVRLQSVASNLANARTTKTPEGGPYARKMPLFEATSTDPFGSELDRAMAEVRVREVVTSDAPPVQVYDPGHPDAGPDGMVALPNVNMLEEMVDMMTTARSYEANATVIEVTVQLAQSALELAR